jgi:hypothetical protein
MINREAIIQNYITGYNQFDIERMVVDFDENIVFENISNDESNMLLTGLQAFREQAEQAKQYFSERTQTVKSFKHHNDKTEIELDYKATLAMDLPNGLKKGEELHLQGKSLFAFSGNKIVGLTDIS